MSKRTAPADRPTVAGRSRAADHRSSSALALVASRRPQNPCNRPMHHRSPHISCFRIVSDHSFAGTSSIRKQLRIGVARIPVAMAASMLSRKTTFCAQAAPVVVVARSLFTHNAVAFRAKGLGLGATLPGRISSSRRNVVRSVAAPLTFVPEPETPEVAEEEEFDAAKKPPFTLSDIRAAIPKHCWEKNQWKSLSYVARDVAIVFGLAAGAAAVNNWLVWPLYWLAQGTMFWALFVLGHDCGHGSFSNNKTLNSLIGHLTHSSILVPYHGWRISHRTHHQNHGHVENDESWHPLTESTYNKLDFWAKVGRLKAPWALFAYPFYLWSRSPGKTGSHYDPKSDLFVPSEAKDVITSTTCWAAMLAALVALSFAIGPMWMFKLYVVPYWVNVMWLDAVTYLHHHGYDKKVPWYRGTEWNYMRGGLSTIDRDYGWINNIHHDIGTHVVHHLFPQIPHYNLIEATEAVKPVLGQYYRDPKKSGPVPMHLVEPLLKSLKEDHFVSDTGDVVHYQTDPNF